MNDITITIPGDATPSTLLDLAGALSMLAVDRGIEMEREDIKTLIRLVPAKSDSRHYTKAEVIGLIDALAADHIWDEEE